MFCGSLLLHLTDPLRALCAIRSVTRELAILETWTDPALNSSHPEEPLARFGVRAQEEADGRPLGAQLAYWSLSGAALSELLAYPGFRDVRRLATSSLPPTPHSVVVAHARP